VVCISALIAIQRSRNELVHQADLAITRRSDASCRGARKQHWGGHGRRDAAKHWDESATQHSKHQGEWADQASQESQGSGGNASQTGPAHAVAGPASPGQTPSASPRARRQALLTTLSSISAHAVDNRADRICLGPGPPGACTHSVTVELALLALGLEHAEDADVHGLSPARAAGRNRD
jgi:hypothetical protein